MGIVVTVVVFTKNLFISLFIQAMKELLSCQHWFGLVLGTNTLSVFPYEFF
jgi:hypothetical protein